MHSDPLMEVTCDMPEDVVLLHDALTKLSTIHNPQSTIHHPPSTIHHPQSTIHHPQSTIHYPPSTLNLHNAGTAFRFLTAYCAQVPGWDVVLDGCDRMRLRPIGPLVDALRSFHVKIDYLGQEGYPPIRIQGHKIETPTTYQVPEQQPISSQFYSALELIGISCQGCSHPYLEMTREVIRQYEDQCLTMEYDWSSAAFWYEYVALYGGTLTLRGLREKSIQGDRIVADIFKSLGVHTLFTRTGARITRVRESLPSSLSVSVAGCPDLYPALMMTCHQLGVQLLVNGIESLPYKESNRIQSAGAMVTTPRGQVVQTEHDHRIAMAAMVARYKVDDEECIRKSYPQFTTELCKLLSHEKA